MKGILALLVATFFFSLYGVFTRLIAVELSAFLQIIIRMIIMSIILVLIGLLFPSFKKIPQKDLPLFFLRGAFVVADLLSITFAFAHISLSLTIFLFYASMTIVNYMYGYFFLQERLTGIKIVSLVMALLGLIVLYSDGFSNISLLPSLAALLSGASFGLNVCIGKGLSERYSITQVNLSSYVIATVLCVPFLVINGQATNFSFSLNTWLLLIGFGIVGTIAMYLTMYGFNKLEVQKASLLLLAELIFVIIVGFVFFQEVPTLRTILGGFLIMIALALPNLSFSRS